MSDSDGDPFSTGAGLGILSELSASDDEALLGRELDGYRITGFIAEGGMSRVYRATRVDGSFERDVAIKLSAISGINSTMRERFMQEQSVLAGLNHPHISQLYDARLTAEGWPYIVMELIEGSPITRFCTERKLALTDRVRLLIDVIDAVAFAHGNLVVHRDIKPSNVLVTTSAEVKLLDFGIAKLLEGDLDNLTRSGAMTPRYASPEQLLGKPISIASDIYQLGLLMAEVLGGSLPTEGETLTDAIRRSADDRPVVLPAAMRQSLPAEITSIIEQCLRPDPGDRYRDANALKSDLVAYLAGYPVAAVGQQSGYRFRKFVQRNRGSVAGALLTLLALVSATVITALQMLEAKQQRDIAVYQQQRVQASNEFYSLLLEETGDGAFTSVELLDRGRALLESQFGTGQPFVASVLYDISKRYSSLGERQRAAELLGNAERIAREYDDSNLLAAVLCRMARSNQAQDPDRAASQLAEGLALYESLAAPGIETSVDCLRARSSAELQAGNADAALAILINAKDLLDAHPSPGTSLRGPILNDIGFQYYREGKLNEAVEYLDDVLELLETTGRGTTLGYQRVAANRAVTLSTLGRTPEALDAFADLAERMRNSGFEGRGAASLLAQYGDLLMSVGRTSDAEAIYAEGLVLAEAGGDARVAAFLNTGLAKVHLANKAFESSMRSLDEAQAYIEADERADGQLAITIRLLRVKVHRNSGDLDAAARDIDALIADTGYPEAQQTPSMISALIEGAEVYRQRGDYIVAEELVDGVVERLEKYGDPDTDGSLYLGRALFQRAEIRLESGNPAGAAADLESALPQLVNALGDDHREVEEARRLLADGREADST
jgi:tetratricopeptide (TPR) repeat protein